MRFEKLCAILDRAYHITTTTGVSNVPYFEGKPGGGKTQKIEQYAQLRGLELATLYGPAMSPTDLVCYMPDADSKTLLAYFNERLPRDPNFKGILFGDEATKMHPEVLKTWIKLINERKLDGYTCPPGLMFVLAGNDMASRSGDNIFPAAFRNRLSRYVFDVDAEEVSEYFISKGYPYEVPAYLAGSPDSVDQFDAAAPSWANPRSWERVALNLAYCQDKGIDIDIETLTADVGKGQATQFFGFINELVNLPSFEEIKKAPKKVEVPTKNSGKCAVLAMCAYRADKASFGALREYIERMEHQWQLMFIRMVRRRHDKSFMQVKEYASWLVVPEIKAALTDR